MDLFGGLIKGLKPLMDATGVKADESMELAVIKSEVGELEKKRRDALADIGELAYGMAKAGTWDRDKILSLCEAVDGINGQLKAKKSEMDRAQQAADEKQKAEEEKLAARTCPDCGEVNPEGTRFCQSCGSRIGVSKPQEKFCQACGAANPPETRFCGECGAKLEAAAVTEKKCPSCGVVCTPETKFCNECGTRL